MRNNILTSDSEAILVPGSGAVLKYKYIIENVCK